MAESLDRQGRQRELNRQERNALRETTIREETMNEMSIQEEVNFMAGRSDGHFNSTMKNNSGRWNNSPNRNTSYNGDRNNPYLVVETTRTKGRTTPTQITDQTGTTLTTGAGTTKAGTPGTTTLIIMIQGED